MNLDTSNLSKKKPKVAQSKGHTYLESDRGVDGL